MRKGWYQRLILIRFSREAALHLLPGERRFCLANNSSVAEAW